MSEPHSDLQPPIRDRSQNCDESQDNILSSVGTPSTEIQRRLCIDRWLTDRGQSFQKLEELDSKNRTVYRLKHCPFDATHLDQAHIMQASSGKLFAVCHQQGCVGKSWKQFKAKIGSPAPGHWEHDLSAAMQSSSCDPDTATSWSSDGSSEGEPPGPLGSENADLANSIYATHRGQIVRLQWSEDSHKVFPLSNFKAQIVEDIYREDGAEQRRMFVIEGQLDNGRSLRRIEVTASEFTSLQ